MNNNENSNFLRNFSNKEIQSIFLGSFSVILYVVSAYFLMVYETSNVSFQLVYVSSIFIFPLILFAFYSQSFFIKNGVINNLGRSFLLINVIFLGLLTVNLFFKITVESMMVLQLFLIISYFFIIISTVDDTEIETIYQSKAPAKLSFNIFNRPLFDKYFVFFMVSVIIGSFSYALYAPFVRNDFEFFEGLVQLNKNTINVKFLSVLLISAICMFWIFFSDKIKKIKENEKFTMLVCFSPILLFNINNNFDIEHYNAFLGPAISVLHGKLPLVDVFCQYGLSYLVFTIAYLFLPNNYAIAAIIVSLLNIICWITLLLIFRRMIKNPLYFGVLSVVLLFGSYYFPLYDNNMIPSTLCMRYLPSIVFSFLLLSKIESSGSIDTLKFFKVDTFNFLIFLNIVWSIEALVSLCIIYGAYLWVMESRWKILVRKFAVLLTCIISVYVLISAVYMIFFHHIPDYWLYLKYIYDYMNPSSSIGNRFLLGEIALYKAFFFWMVLAVMHLVIFFKTINYRFCKEKISIKTKMLFFLNTVCISFMAYFALQASILSMMSSGFLSFILLFSILVMEKEQTKRFALQLCASALLFMIAFIFFVMIAKTFFLERKNVYRNGDILYAFFHEGFSVFNKFFYNATHFCSNKEESIESGSRFAIEENTCKRNDYHDEIYRVMKKWYSNEPEVLLFHRDLIEILMEHKKVHKFLSHTVNDAFLHNFDVKIAHSIKEKVHEGEIVVVEKNLDVLPIEYRIISAMAQHFHFKMMEETPHLRIFKLTNKNSEQKNDLLFPLTVKAYSTSVDDKDEPGSQSSKSSVLFDKDKWTSWFVPKKMLEQSAVFWISMDFGQIFLMDDIKIWRRIDFRKPTYVKTESFRFIPNFNLELSEDNKRWFMVASESSADILDQPFYEARFTPHKARYVRLNIFAEDMRYFSISEIEVFGQKLE